MMPDRRLVFFTDSFPYGIGEQWKTNDLEFLVNRFDEVMVVPLSYGGSETMIGKVPESVRVLPPLFESIGKPSLLLSSLRYLLSFFVDPTLRNHTKATWTTEGGPGVKRLCIAYSRAIQTRNRINRLGLWNENNAEQTSLFFFWGLGAAEALPWLKPKFDRVVIGFHGYDLYEHRHQGHAFPFRTEMLRKADVAAPCSKNGATHLRSQYPDFSDKVIARTLGTNDRGPSPWQPSNTLRVVSCAFVSPVKRLNLLVDAFSETKSTIEWTHIGGGDSLAELKSYAAERLGSTKVATHFTGSLKTDDVRRHLEEHEFDCLISTSSSEGVPVSMMEAICAGIPILATAVGGVPELVDENSGILLPPDPTAHQIAQVIDDFAQKTPEEKEHFREGARANYMDNFRTPKVIEEFFNAAFPIRSS